MPLHQGQGSWARKSVSASPACTPDTLLADVYLTESASLEGAWARLYTIARFVILHPLTVCPCLTFPPCLICPSFRDLKPENILLSDKTPQAELKVIDFGTSDFCVPGQRLQQKFGTPYYVAPEVSDAQCRGRRAGRLQGVSFSGGYWNTLKDSPGSRGSAPEGRHAG